MVGWPFTRKRDAIDSKKVRYEAIYAIDNVFDDTPEAWHALERDAIAHYGNFVPESPESITNQPCGLLREMATQAKKASPTKENQAIAALLDASRVRLAMPPDTIMHFNAMAYHYHRIGQQREAVMAHEADGSTDREGRIELARRNFHGSLVARSITEYGEELTLFKEKILHPDAVLVRPIGTTHTFPDRVTNEPTTALLPFFAPNPGYMSHASKLSQEMRTFIMREWKDFIVDLEQEARSHHPTPNVVVAYLFAKHPELTIQDVQAMRERLQRAVPQEPNRYGAFGLEEQAFMAQEPLLADIKHDMDQMYGLKADFELFMHGSIEARDAFRTQVRAERAAAKSSGRE